MWQNMHTKYHEDWYRRSGNIKALHQQFGGCNLGITDGRDL
jgi:hypothetical protein